MNTKIAQKRALTEIYWSGTVLNIYTIGLMVLGPIWGAYLLSRGHTLSLFVLVFLILAMMAYSFVDKPLMAYDPERKVLITPDGFELALDQVRTIDMDARDLYVIPNDSALDAWRFSARGWVLSPRRTLQSLAKAYGWPLNDITRPIKRYGYWLLP